MTVPVSAAAAAESAPVLAQRVGTDGLRSGQASTVDMFGVPLLDSYGRGSVLMIDPDAGPVVVLLQGGSAAAPTRACLTSVAGGDGAPPRTGPCVVVPPGTDTRVPTVGRAGGRIGLGFVTTGSAEAVAVRISVTYRPVDGFLQARFAGR